MDSLSSLHEDDEASKPELEPKDCSTSSTSTSTTTCTVPSGGGNPLLTKSGLDLESHIKKIISQNEAIIDPLWNKKYSSSRHHSTSSLPRGSHPFGTVGAVFGQSTVPTSTATANLAPSTSTTTSSAASASLFQNQQSTQQFGANPNNSNNPIDFSLNSNHHHHHKNNSSQSGAVSYNHNHQRNFPPMSINSFNYPSIAAGEGSSLEDQFDSYVRRRYSDITFSERRASVGSRLQSALMMGKSSSAANVPSQHHRPSTSSGNRRSPSRKLAIPGATNPYESVIKDGKYIVNPYDKSSRNNSNNLQQFIPGAANYVAIGGNGGNGSAGDYSGSLVRDLLTSKVPILASKVSSKSGKSSFSSPPFGSENLHPDNPERSVIKDLLLKARESNSSNNNNSTTSNAASVSVNSPPSWTSTSPAAINERKRSSPTSAAATSVVPMNITSPPSPPPQVVGFGQDQDQVSNNMLYYVCTICQIAFRNKENLTIHQAHYCKGGGSILSMNAPGTTLNTPAQLPVSGAPHVVGGPSVTTIPAGSGDSSLNSHEMLPRMAALVNTSNGSKSSNSCKNENRKTSLNSGKSATVSGQRSSSGASNTIFGGSGPGIVTVINDHVQRKISVMEMSPSVLHRRLTEGRTNNSSSSTNSSSFGTVVTGDKKKTNSSNSSSSPSFSGINNTIMQSSPSMAIGVDQQMLFNTRQGHQNPHQLVSPFVGGNNHHHNNNSTGNVNDGSQLSMERGQTNQGPTLGMILKSTLEGAAKKRKISEPVFPSHRSSFLNLPTIIEPPTRDQEVVGQRSPPSSSKVQKSSGSFGSSTSKAFASNHNQRAFSVGSRPLSIPSRKVSNSGNRAKSSSSSPPTEEMMVDEENEQLMREVVSKTGMKISASMSDPNSRSLDGMDNGNDVNDDDEEGEELVVDDDCDLNHDGHECQADNDGQGRENRKIGREEVSPSFAAKDGEDKNAGHKRGSGSPWTSTGASTSSAAAMKQQSSLSSKGVMVEVLPEYLPFMKVPETKITIEGPFMFPVLERILTNSCNSSATGQTWKSGTNERFLSPLNKLSESGVKGHQDEDGKDKWNKHHQNQLSLCKSLPPLIKVTSPTTESTPESQLQQKQHSNCLLSSPHENESGYNRDDDAEACYSIEEKEEGGESINERVSGKNEHRPCPNGVNETSPQVVVFSPSIPLVNSGDGKSCGAVQPCSSSSSILEQSVAAADLTEQMAGEKSCEKKKERIVQKVMQVPSIQLLDYYATDGDNHDQEVGEERKKADGRGKVVGGRKSVESQEDERMETEDSELGTRIIDDHGNDEMELDEGREGGKGIGSKCLSRKVDCNGDSTSVSVSMDAVTCYGTESMVNKQGQEGLIDPNSTIDGKSIGNEYSTSMKNGSSSCLKGMNCLIKDKEESQEEAGKRYPCNNQNDGTFVDKSAAAGTVEALDGTEINNNSLPSMTSGGEKKECFDGQSLKKDINKCSIGRGEERESEERNDITEGKSNINEWMDGRKVNNKKMKDDEEEEEGSSCSMDCCHDEEQSSEQQPEGGELRGDVKSGEGRKVITSSSSYPSTSSPSITGREEEEGEEKEEDGSKSKKKFASSDTTRIKQFQPRPSTLDFLSSSDPRSCSTSSSVEASSQIGTVRRRRFSTGALITSTIVSPDCPRPRRPFSQQYLNGHAYTTLGLKVSTRSTYCCIFRPQPMFVHQEMDPHLSMYSNWQVAPQPATGSPFLDTFPPKSLLESYNSNLNQESPTQENGVHYTPSYKLGINSGQQQMTPNDPSTNPIMAAMISTDSKYWTSRSQYEQEQVLRGGSAQFDESAAHFRRMSSSFENSRKMSEDRMTIGSDHSSTFTCNQPGCTDQYCHIPHSHNLAPSGSMASGSSNNPAADQPKRVKIFEGGFKSNEDYTYVRGRGRGKYVCEECGIRCKKPSMLKKHIRTHTDLRPYSCRHCAFAFKTKGNLTKHMKSKAHHKKCVEMGIVPVPTAIDETQIDAVALAKQEAMERSFSGGHSLMSDEDDDNDMDEDGEYDDDYYDEGSDDEGVPIPLTHPSFNNYVGASTASAAANYYSPEKQTRKISMESLTSPNFGISRTLAVSPVSCPTSSSSLIGENRCRRVSMTLTPSAVTATSSASSSFAGGAGTFKTSSSAAATCASNLSPFGLNNNNSNSCNSNWIQMKKGGGGSVAEGQTLLVNCKQQKTHQEHGSSSASSCLPAKEKEEGEKERVKKRGESDADDEEAVAAQSLLTLSGSWTASSLVSDKQGTSLSSSSSGKTKLIPSGIVSKVTSIPLSSSSSSGSSPSPILDTSDFPSSSPTSCPAPGGVAPSPHHHHHPFSFLPLHGKATVVTATPGPTSGTSTKTGVPPSLPWTSVSKGDQTSGTTATTSIVGMGMNSKQGLKQQTRGGGASSMIQEEEDADVHESESTPSMTDALIKSPSSATTIITSKSRKISILESTLNNWNPYTNSPSTSSSTSSSSSSRPRSYSFNDRILTQRNKGGKLQGRSSHHHPSSNSPTATITSPPTKKGTTEGERVSRTGAIRTVTSILDGSNVTSKNSVEAAQSERGQLEKLSIMAMNADQGSMRQQQQLVAGQKSPSRPSPAFSPSSPPTQQSIAQCFHLRSSPSNSNNGTDQSMEIVSNIDGHQGPSGMNRMMERKISARTEVGMSLEKLTIKEGISSEQHNLKQQQQPLHVYQSVIQSNVGWNVGNNQNNNNSDDHTFNCITNSSSSPTSEGRRGKKSLIISNNKSGDDSAVESESDPNSPDLIDSKNMPLMSSPSKMDQLPNNSVLVLLAEQQHQLQQQQQQTNNAMRRYSTSVITGGHSRHSPTSGNMYPWMTTSGKRSLDTDIPIDLSKRVSGSGSSDDHDSPSDDEDAQLAIESNGMFNADGSFNFNHPFCPPQDASDNGKYHSRQDFIPIPLQSGSEEGEGKCVCTTCGKTFPRPSQLRIHMNIHYIERQFKCDECGVSFRSAGHLSKHKRSNAHEEKKKMNATFGLPNPDNPRPFKCVDCKTSFRIHGHLAKHLRSKLHIMKLECLSKVPFGLYAEMERTNVNPNDIDTTDCENCLISLQQLSTKILPNVPLPSGISLPSGSGSPTGHDDHMFAVPRTNSGSMSSSSSLNSYVDEGVGSISGSQSLIGSQSLMNNQPISPTGLSSKRVKTETQMDQMMRERSMSFSGPVSLDHHNPPSFGHGSSDFMERRNTIVASDYHRFMNRPSFSGHNPFPFMNISSSGPFTVPFPVNTSSGGNPVSCQSSAAITGPSMSSAPSAGTSTSATTSLRSNTCDICHQVFKSAKSLQVHLYTDHPDKSDSESDSPPTSSPSTFNCEVCSKKLSSLSDLQQHLLTHSTSPRPYICSVCDAGFATASQLTSHIPSHSVLQQVR